jgi:hypothetical protein
MTLMCREKPVARTITWAERAKSPAEDDFSANVLPIVRQIEAAGGTTNRVIAAALNARGVRTSWLPH